jgi:hypothetical protein
MENVYKADLVQGCLLFNRKFHVIRRKTEERPGSVAGFDDIDDDKVIDFMQHGYQLMAHRPGLEELNVAGQSSAFQGVDKMDTETIVPEKQIAYTENENFLGRRCDASPDLFI